MKNLKIKTFVGILFITIIIASFASNTVFAAINHTYGDTVVVSDTSLDEKAVNAGLVEIFAQMVYWLASWIESTVADAFAILTGENEFPWADRVIFNSVAFLDVNFINPADGSLFKSKRVKYCTCYCDKKGIWKCNDNMYRFSWSGSFVDGDSPIY